MNKEEKKRLHEKKKAEFAACKSVEEMDKVMHKYRSYDMLTVKDLIKFLKKCNPNACVLGFEPNSNAWIEQFKELPNNTIRTVADEKISYRESLKNWYKGSKDAKKKIEKDMKEVFRYSEDDDIVVRF